jgi:hypothetical protein
MRGQDWKRPTFLLKQITTTQATRASVHRAMLDCDRSKRQTLSKSLSNDRTTLN